MTFNPGSHRESVQAGAVWAKDDIIRFTNSRRTRYQARTLPHIDTRRYYGTDAQSWMNLQDRYELALAEGRLGDALAAIQPRGAA